MLGEIRADAARAVRLDLALRALADAEDIEVTDDELDEEVAEMAEQAGTSAGRSPAPTRPRRQAARGTLGQRKAKALTWLFDHVELVDEDGKPLSRDDLQVDVAAQGAGGAGTGGARGQRRCGRARRARERGRAG